MSNRDDTEKDVSRRSLLKKSAAGASVGLPGPRLLRPGLSGSVLDLRHTEADRPIAPPIPRDDDGRRRLSGFCPLNTGGADIYSRSCKLKFHKESFIGQA
jgi:hypothetical protein